MLHYEQRLAADLEEIRKGIDAAATDVVSALTRTVQGIRSRKPEILHDVVLDDNAINRKIRSIDARCHAFVARHLPAAGHLRFVSSVLRINVALERAGDYAVTISRVVLQLDKELSDEIIANIAELAALSCTMMQDAVQEFLAGNAERARVTWQQGLRIDRLYDSIFHDLVAEKPQRGPMELATLLTIFGKIERFSDQARNICKETVFASTGGAIGHKVFRILFLDERNDFVSHLAAAIGNKSFGDDGLFSSAGWAPADEIDPRLQPIADRFGLDIGRVRPTRVQAELPDYPVDYHVVVALGADTDEHVPRIPYHTALQSWRDLVPPTTTDERELAEATDALVRILTERIGRLMERLRGPD